jgi:hypothetical protein
MVSKLKRPPQSGKKYLPATSDKRLITRIYRELRKLNSLKKINEPIKKWASEINRNFSKEEISQKKKFKWPKNT